MAKPSRPHPIFDLARTRNRNTTWDGLIIAANYVAIWKSKHERA